MATTTRFGFKVLSGIGNPRGLPSAMVNRTYDHFDSQTRQAVLRRALAQASVSATDVGYIEAHGTGTPLGDPIEVRAVNAVYGTERPAGRPLAIGSVKTNIGHLESAAGVAGLIKAVLAMRYREIPPHLHVERLNPLISLEPGIAYIPKVPMPWTEQRIADPRPGFAGPG